MFQINKSAKTIVDEECMAKVANQKILLAWHSGCILECSLTCGSLRPLESESDVSLYSELAISTSVDALLRFFSGLHESEISLAPTGLE